MSIDLKDTLFLPRTDFPMRASLPKREPELMRRWEEIDLFGLIRESSKDRDIFTLHDGPPYANGNIHMGHALNKILKDIINRTQQMIGKNATFVPGWDCHGLPIEWKIEERYRSAGKNKDDVPLAEFRQECRDFAENWIKIQREEFKRLGVVADWENGWTTMTHRAEAATIRECHKFLMNGSLVRGAMPVMWSTVEKTALAEAEVEYHDHTSETIYVRFPIIGAGEPALEGASIVIWTTTPWTMPGNRAIAYGESFVYKLVEVTDVADDSLATIGEKIVLVSDLFDEVFEQTGITGYRVLGEIDHRSLEKTVCRHPWRGRGYDHDVRLLPGDMVTTEQGTGFVHIAPGGGADDYWLAVKHGIEVPDTVDADGSFYAHVPILAGYNAMKADDVVIAELKAASCLLASMKYTHRYPHSWRSRAPLIFRNTPQWFISMDKTGLRERALAAIDDEVKWIPAQSRERIRSMVAGRPDWVISRQRAWGVPLAIFMNRKTRELLCDTDVNERIAAAVEVDGADAWFEREASEFLGDEYDAADYDKIDDILDVWFDSGCSYVYSAEARDDLVFPVSAAAEGTDQHRGFFQSSLLWSCGARNTAPYRKVLTHGFVVDGQGRKMSKSIGNVVAPQEIIEKYGADILRLWVVNSNYTGDLRVDAALMQKQSDAYRRIRNTFRFLLGNLAHFDESERLPVERMPELEKWVLHRLVELDEKTRKGNNEFNFHKVFLDLFAFCNTDLSSFYFDIRKDALYCDAALSIRRRAARTVLDQIFKCLSIWLAPYLCFTAEEAWLHRYPGDKNSVHTQLFPKLQSIWRSSALDAKWREVSQIRKVVLGALEVARTRKTIGAGLEAHVQIYLSQELYALVHDIDMAEICITSRATVSAEAPPDDAFCLDGINGIAVWISHSEGDKCDRCWRILPEVANAATSVALCTRCHDAIADRF